MLATNFDHSAALLGQFKCREKSQHNNGANILAILTVSSRLKDGWRELAGEVIQRLRKRQRGPNEVRLGLGGQFVWDFAYRAWLASPTTSSTTICMCLATPANLEMILQNMDNPEPAQIVVSSLSQDYASI
jgi:hypothetical protein